MQTLKMSLTPQADIEFAAYPGQNPKFMQFRSGYEFYFNQIPELSQGHPFLNARVNFAGQVLDSLAEHLRHEEWVTEKVIRPFFFERTIIGIEEEQPQRESAEVVVAQWGKGFASPIHGHASGFMREDILTGKMLVNQYRIVDESSATVRPVRTDIVGPGTFASVFNKKPLVKSPFKRPHLIHNFKALETSASLHFLPEHTRDGRDNTFKAEYFEEIHALGFKDVVPLTPQQTYYLPVGSVILVRSSNVPDYGDHYIVITGHPVLKEHGLRPQDIAIQAPKTSELLSYYNHLDVILLQLNPDAQKRFYEFHDITIENGKVVFPNS